ncbi:hypothetical protein [Natrarchaeobius oligotrophus]|uniref:hypothetical protein n=1 Tax=Natrarchaeobius oligotrophus TaxID=3455743 RepID=UPI001A9F9D8F|nr:hypothetical protein [Natrarchaeobius chitinivorans]
MSNDDSRGNESPDRRDAPTRKKQQTTESVRTRLERIDRLTRTLLIDLERPARNTAFEGLSDDDRRDVRRYLREIRAEASTVGLRVIGPEASIPYRPEDEPMDEPAGEQIDDPADEPIDDPADEPIDEPANEPEPFDGSHVRITTFDGPTPEAFERALEGIRRARASKSEKSNENADRDDEHESDDETVDDRSSDDSSDTHEDPDSSDTPNPDSSWNGGDDDE